MKSGNYDRLMDKFYAGRASTEEISILKGEGLLDDQDIFYAELLNSERGQKMDWDFEDLIKEVPATKVVALPARRSLMKRIMAAAAVVATILIAYIFWPQQQKQKQIVHVPVINKKADSGRKLPTTPSLAVHGVKDSVFLSEDVKNPAPAGKNYAVKTRKESGRKSTKDAASDKEENTMNSQHFMVMVNGKPVTDEADAIQIMKESLSMVSRDITNTVEELKPMGQIKIKL